MSTKEHKQDAPKIAKIAIITLSDSRTIDQDESGHLIKELLIEQNHQITDHILIEDNKVILENQIHILTNRADIIITNGGTGITKKDITIDTLKPLYQKEIPGFQIIFTLLSYEEIKSSAILSRASAGIINNTTIFSIPGSPKACKLALEKIIIPEIGHIIKHLND